MKWTIPFGAVLGLACASLNGETLTLNAITNEALALNPKVQAAKEIWQAKIKQARINGAWEDPKLHITTLLGRFVDVPQNAFTDQSVGLEQTIPISGKNRVQARIALAGAEQSFQDYRRQQLDIVAQVSRAVFEIASLNEQIALNRADLMALDQTVSTIRSKFEAGKGSQSDINLAEIARDQMADSQRDLDQKLVETKTKLNVLLNRDAFAPLSGVASLPSKPGVPSSDRLRSLLLAYNPEVLQASASLAAARLKVELARRNWIPDPTLSIQASHYNGGSQFASEASGGLSFSLPWVNGGKYHAVEDQARDEIQAAFAMLESIQRESIAKLRIQMELVMTLHHHLGTYEEKLGPAANQAVSASEADYENDKIALSDLLTAQNNLRSLKANQIVDLANYQSALADLDSIVGFDTRTIAVHRPASK